MTMATIRVRDTGRGFETTITTWGHVETIQRLYATRRRAENAGRIWATAHQATVAEREQAYQQGN